MLVKLYEGDEAFALKVFLTIDAIFYKNFLYKSENIYSKTAKRSKKLRL